MTASASISYTVLGIMSGSSKDGLDMSLLKFDWMDGDLQFEIIHNEGFDFPIDIKRLLAVNKNSTIEEILRSDHSYCIYIADQILSISNNQHIDYIAFHGHTIVHVPQENISYQMGSGAHLSALTGIACVTDFRLQDITLGGEGTPLAPLADKWLFPGHDMYINIGGIANITVVDNGIHKGFDICPANQVLNHFAQKLGKEYDKNGVLAKSGTVDDSVLNEIIALDYFNKKGPKSLDNNWIVEKHIPWLEFKNIEPQDMLRTYIQVLVLLVEKVARQANVSSIFITGGGIKNLYLEELLINAIVSADIQVKIPDPDIIDYKEAMLMALAGFFRVIRVNNVYNTVTGASRDSVGGALYETNG